MLRKPAIFAVASALSLVAGASLTLAADNSSPPTQSDTNTNGEPGSKDKTSDRTPGNPAPDRTPNASSSGNTGTDASQTKEGTSDRTPSKDDKSMSK